eukprot:960409-Pelagomonas_calceolata.AAC.3
MQTREDMKCTACCKAGGAYVLPCNSLKWLVRSQAGAIIRQGKQQQAAHNSFESTADSRHATAFLTKAPDTRQHEHANCAAPHLATYGRGQGHGRRPKLRRMQVQLQETSASLSA